MCKGWTSYIGCRWNGMRFMVELSMNQMAVRILVVELSCALLREKIIHWEDSQLRELNSKEYKRAI